MEREEVLKMHDVFKLKKKTNQKGNRPKRH